MSVDRRELLLLMKSDLSVFVVVAYAFGIVSKKLLLNPVP